MKNPYENGIVFEDFFENKGLRIFEPLPKNKIMAKKNKYPAPRIEFFRNKKGEFNYHSIGANGKIISGGERQGYNRFAGLRDNIITNALFYGVRMAYVEVKDIEQELYPDVWGLFEDQVSDFHIPIYRIDS